MTTSRFTWGFSLKDVVYIVLIGVVCFFGYRIYQDLKSDIHQTSVAYKQLEETLARAENNMVTKAELNEFAKVTGINLKAIKDDLKGLDAELSAVGETVASIKGEIEQNQGSDSTVDHDVPDQPETCKLCDIHGYTGSTQSKNVAIGDMPYAKVEFDAASNKPWSVAKDDIDVKVTTVLGRSDKQDVTIFYHTISLLNNTRPELKDKLFKLKITSSKFVETLDNTKEWFLWAPHLSISLDNQFVFEDEFYRFGGSLGISVMAYGKTKDDNDWRFVKLGMGINSKENPYLSFEPVQYNLGRKIPLVSDLWIGASILYDGSFGIGISIGTTL